MGSTATQSLFALAITVWVVYRFARRELRERIVKRSTLWIRPAIMVALTVYLVYLSADLDPLGDGEMLAVLAGGAILGVIAGLAIVRNTRFRPAGMPNAVRAVGNKITFAIWIVALAVRLLMRFILPHGADPAAQLPLNCGTVVMTAVAFSVIAVAFWYEIARYAGVPVAETIAAPLTIEPGTSTLQ
jgi:hypothetical protein